MSDDSNDEFEYQEQEVYYASDPGYSEDWFLACIILWLNHKFLFVCVNLL